MTWQILHGDCLAVMRSLNAESVDAIVTDPPAGVRFMGQAWDGDRGGMEAWVDWLAERLAEALRVAKPGAHALVWALPRTSHWTGLALERSGWEVRDVITHLFGSGFPKSLDVAKAIDKTDAWVRRSAAHGDGIALVFARTDTAWFHEVAQTAHALCFLAGRLTFVPAAAENVAEGRTNGNAGAPSLLLAFGEECAAAVAASGLGMTFAVRARPALGQASLWEAAA